ncbi:CRISPR-associated protein Csx18 [Pseudanabaena minima]|uniref:CRISPR-associated protein Csx18 n=1 Tax=Pseudanabaena minima TaxID=890415 RepID=UPI003DA7CEBC
MYFLTDKVARVRNISVSAANGAISLTILLIAPMGLFAVIVNTLLIVAATYGCLTVSDRILVYLLRDERGRDSLGAARDSSELRKRD